MAAIGSNSLKAAAEYSDGLVTFLNPKETKEIKLLDKFNKDVEAAGKNPDLMEKIVEYKVSYSEDYDKALLSANFWRATLIKNAFNSDISDPRKMEKKAKENVSDKKLKDSIQITTSVEECIKSIEEYFDVGYTRVHIHSTSPDEIEFIHQFCKKVLPYFDKENAKI
jgi:coenzyme F420-dependent glucose-6-phosphate dehydrogenase